MVAHGRSYQLELTLIGLGKFALQHATRNKLIDEKLFDPVFDVQRARHSYGTRQSSLIRSTHPTKKQSMVSCLKLKSACMYLLASMKQQTLSGESCITSRIMSAQDVTMYNRIPGDNTLIGDVILSKYCTTANSMGILHEKQIPINI